MSSLGIMRVPADARRGFTYRRSAFLAQRLTASAGFSVFGFDLLALRALLIVVVDFAIFRRVLLRICVIRGHGSPRATRTSASNQEDTAIAILWFGARA